MKFNDMLVLIIIIGFDWTDIGGPLHTRTIIFQPI